MTFKALDTVLRSRAPPIQALFSPVRVEIYSSLDELQKLQPEWRDLAANAVEQNINYEPTPLLSLLANVDYPGWFVVGIWNESRLSGLFPMQKVKRLPVPIFQFSCLYFNHLLSCMPLVHSADQDEVIDTFWNWINGDDRAKVFYVPVLLDKSELGLNLIERGKASSLVLKSHTSTRAVWAPDGTDYDTYFKTRISTKNRSASRRKMRKLEEMGGFHLKFTAHNSPEFFQQFDHLVQVEGSGWKRDNGSAIILNPGVRQFMLDTALYAIEKQRFLLVTGFVEDKPVTGFYCLINDGKLMVYKIGYDEEYKSFAVGQHTLLGIIKHAISDPAIHTIDSCAASDSEIYNRFLPDVQILSEYQIASKHWLSKFCLKSVVKSRAVRIKLKSLIQTH